MVGKRTGTPRRTYSKGGTPLLHIIKFVDSEGSVDCIPIAWMTDALEPFGLRMGDIILRKGCDKSALVIGYDASRDRMWTTSTKGKDQLGFWSDFRKKWETGKLVCARKQTILQEKTVYYAE